MLTCVAASAQVAVNRIFPDDDTVWTVVTSGTALNETAGANQTWVFDQLVSLGDTSYQQETPTPADISTYPNTTGVLQSADTGSIYYALNLAGNLTVTGIASTEFNINYSTNNANVGQFPMSFGYTNSDTTAGTYSGMGYSGTFSGTVATSVDAYGSLTRNIGFGLPTYDVTRVKVVQTLSLNYLIFNNIGTATQTTYTYFNENVGPIFRTTTLTINVPQLNLDETSTTIETLIAGLLSTPANEANNVVLYPNPTKNTLNIESENQVKAISIADMTGKTVLHLENPASQIDISGLATGIYSVTVSSDTGTKTQKLIKN